MTWHLDCLPKGLWDSAKTLAEIAREQKAVLAGGTALTLRLGHRISVDLDFFSPGAIRHEKILRLIRARFGAPVILVEDADSLVTLVSQGDRGAAFKLSFFQHEYPFIETEDLDGIAVAATLDIAAMKLIAISQRGLKRDFVDLHRILQSVPFFKIAEHACERYGSARINPLVIGKALAYFADADGEPDPEYPRGKQVKWEAIRSFYRSRVRQLVLDLETARSLETTETVR